MLSFDTGDDEALVFRPEGAQGLLIAGAQLVPEGDFEWTDLVGREILADVHERGTSSEPACLVADQIEDRPAQVRLDGLRVPRPEQRSAF